jgi:hypothetical protein
MAKSKVRIGRFSDFAINPNRRVRPTDYPINDAKSSYRFLKTIRSIDDAADIPEQWRQKASILEQGYAGHSPNSANRTHQITRHPWRTSPPLRRA